MTRIIFAIATVLSMGFTPLAAQETNCDGWASPDPDVRNPFWEMATVDTVSGCVNAGADVNGDDEIKPLHFASVFNSNPAVIKVLLEAGANVNSRNRLGATAIFLAVALNSKPEVPAALLDAGADVNIRNIEGFTPLHGKPFGDFSPYLFNNIAAMSMLLNAGADVNARSENGSTPLHTAAAGSDNPDIITFLLDAGADGTAVNDDLQTPFDLARDNEALAGTAAYWALNDARFE